MSNFADDLIKQTNKKKKKNNDMLKEFESFNEKKTKSNFAEQVISGTDPFSNYLKNEQKKQNQKNEQKKQNQYDEMVRETAKQETGYKVYQFLNGQKDKVNNMSQNSWFNGDGKGSILERTLATGVDIGTNYLSGIISTGDKIGDYVSYGVALVADFAGAKDYANDVRQGAKFDMSDMFTGNLKTTEFGDRINATSWAGDKLDSVFKSIGESFGLAKLGKLIKAGGWNKTIKIGKKQIDIPMTSFITGMSSGMSEAYENGATNTQALTKGLSSGLIEGFTEGLFGVFGQGGSSIEDNVIYALTNKIENQLARRITKTGITALGEGAEEGISYVLNFVSDNLQDAVNDVIGSEYKNKTDWNWAELGESILAGSLAGGISGSVDTITQNNSDLQYEQKSHEIEKAQGKALTESQKTQLYGIVQNASKNKSEIKTEDIIRELETNDKVRNTLLEERVQEYKETKAQEMGDDIIPEDVPVSNKELEKIEKQLDKDIKEGRITTTKIESILTSEQDTKKIEEVVSNVKEYNDKLDSLKEKIDNEKNADRKVALENQYNRIAEELKQYKDSNSAFVENYYKSANVVRNNEYNPYINSYIREYNENQAIQYDTTNEKNQAAKEYYESINNHDIKNTETQRKELDVIGNIVKRSNVNTEVLTIEEGIEKNIIKEKNNLDEDTKTQIAKLEEQIKNETNKDKIRELKSELFELKYELANGAYDGKIHIFIDSNGNINQVFTHELRHSLEQAKLSDKFDKMLFDFARQQYSFNDKENDYEYIKKLVEENYDGESVDSEVSAYLTQKYLGNEDFLNKLAQDNTISQKIKSFFKNLKTMFKGTTYEKNILKLEKTFNKMVDEVAKQRENGVIEANGTQMSLAKVDQIENAYRLNGKNKQYFEDAIYNLRDALELQGSMSNEDLFKKTGWATINDEWYYDVDDNINENESSDFRPIIKLEPNKKYFLEDVIDHELLFDLEDSLRYIDVITTEPSSGGINYDEKGRLVYYEGQPALAYIVLNNNYINNLDEMEYTLSHELQHYLQKVADLNDELKTNFEIIDYLKNKLEIGASNNEERARLSKKERLMEAPELFKDNPLHKFIRENPDNELSKTIMEYYNVSIGENTNEKIIDKNKKTNNEILSQIDEKKSLGRKNTKNLDTDKVSFSLNERLSGDELENTIDFINEIKEVGAKVDDNGYVKVYHQTSQENANKILKTGKMSGKEYGIFFSTSRNAQQSEGRGNVKLEFNIPAEKLILDDIFSDNADVKLESKPNQLVDVSDYIDKNTKYSLLEDDKGAKFTDNKGRKLSTEQQEYFKDETKELLDSNGNLKVLYNGSGYFNTYDNTKMSDGSKWGKGIYLTEYQDIAEMYGPDVKEVYAKITNPLSDRLKTITFEQYNDLYQALYDGEEAYREEYDMYSNDLDLLWEITNKGSWADYANEIKEYTGKDGIIVNRMEKTEDMVIAFQSNQIKRVDNLNPTDNEDIRFSKNILPFKTNSKVLEQVELTDGESKYKNIQDMYDYFNKSNVKPINQEQPNEVIETNELVEKPTRHEVIQKNRLEAREKLGDLSEIKDKTMGIFYKTNTMKRNLRDIMSKEKAQELYKTYFQPVTTENAQIEKEINRYNERIEKYDINDTESTYIQMLGELKYNPETSLTSDVVRNYYETNKNKIDNNKCNQAVEEFRNIYDELIAKVNDTLVQNGYKEIPYRKGYFPHFIEDKPNNILGKFAEKMGWKIKSGTLPTDIAGITDQFVPGKAWTSFSQRRTGDATDYNALKGYDNYIRGAMDVIYHTNTIQKLRALETEIRYQYSEKGVQEKIDNILNNDALDIDEKQNQIDSIVENVRNNPLGNFATAIRAYTNNLANKKSGLDRGMEQDFSRTTYSIMQNINSRVSANMVGANISSAVTNFIPITQAWSQVSTKNLMRGIYEGIKTTIKNDGFEQNSTYLTNRTQQADRLYKSGIDKINDKLGIPFEAIDEFTSNVIVRAKYYDNLQKGMNEVESMENADEFAKDVMAGRSKGDQPTIFDAKNPMVKLFTAFQLEVNNQFGYMFKDLPDELKKEGMSKLIGAFFKMFLGAWLYNEISEKVKGRRDAFDPIDMAISDIEKIADTNTTLADDIKNIGTETIKEMPFIGGILGGGRLPIQGAIPSIGTTITSFSTLNDIEADEDKKKTAINNIIKEWEKPVFYLGLPFAGGQIKKTIEGLSMFNEDLPTSGSYTNSGKLRFPVEDTLLNRVQAGIFGQYANENAKQYFDEGRTPLSKKQTEEYKQLDMPIADYWKYRDELKGLTKIEDKLNVINNFDATNEQKNIMAKNVQNSKSKLKIDMNEFKKYSNYNEYKYATDSKTSNKYKAITQITDYDTYEKYRKKINTIKNNSINDKERVIEYINGLMLSIPKKAMLIKLYYPSFKSYDDEVVNYINNSNLSYNDKVAVLKELGFKN